MPDVSHNDEYERTGGLQSVMADGDQPMTYTVKTDGLTAGKAVFVTDLWEEAAADIRAKIIRGPVIVEAVGPCHACGLLPRYGHAPECPNGLMEGDVL